MKMKTFYVLKKLEKLDDQGAAEMRLNNLNPDKPKVMEVYEHLFDAQQHRDFLTKIHAQVCQEWFVPQTEKYSVDAIEVDPDTTLADARYFESNPQSVI